MSAVVNTRGSIEQSALSPDGRWLAYASDESGRLELYAQAYPSPKDRVMVSQDGGTRPIWSRTGDAIYFVAGTTVTRRSGTGQPELRFGERRVIVNDSLLAFQTSAKPFDVAPDGRILAIREDDSVRSDHIVVVQNWLAR